MQICASLNHRKKMKAEPSRLIPLKPIENLELLIVVSGSDPLVLNKKYKKKPFPLNKTNEI